jgi:hypothetical protein
VAVVEDEPPVKIAKGAAQSPMAVAVTRIAAASPFAESKDIHLSYKITIRKKRKKARKEIKAVTK